MLQFPCAETIDNAMDLYTRAGTLAQGFNELVAEIAAPPNEILEGDGVTRIANCLQHRWKNLNAIDEGSDFIALSRAGMELLAHAPEKLGSLNAVIGFDGSTDDLLHRGRGEGHERQQD